uniref:Uncharacterized protein n=1 Tax=Rhizophagus irregularis (strain DAOM 181602 / DAOM 197198 / MUCL 43194) TaxID=747089 RepID=U9UEU7_RHIID
MTHRNGRIWSKRNGGARCFYTFIIGKCNELKELDVKTFIESDIGIQYSLVIIIS